MEVFTPPQTLSGSTDEKFLQLRSFLYQLVDKLNRAVTDIDTGMVQTNETVVRSVATETAKKASESAANLKALIIENKHTLEEKIETLSSSLSGTYLAISDFGTYQSSVTTQFEATPETVSQAIHYESTIQTVNDAIAALNEYQDNMDGYIRSGIVYYDGADPVIGIAIGRNLTTTATYVDIDGNRYYEIDKQSFSSVFTDSELAFFDGTQKVAYINNQSLYITFATFTGNVHHGDKWEVSHANGYTIKWIGGSN